VILLDVVPAGAEVDDTAVVQPGREALGERGRDERAGAPGEEEPGVARLAKRGVGLAQGRVDVRRLAGDRKLIR
jgi:hypothetical protein